MNETDLIMRQALAAHLDSSQYGLHLSSRINVLTYVRFADEIKSKMSSGNILDWGCGFGQMSFLLQQRNLQVSSYDIADQAYTGPSTVFPSVTILRGDDPAALPFPDESFDAVLSCGVLEHVPQEMDSLKEIHRILRPGGRFFIYNLPQQGSYKEFILEKIHVGYTHERKYTVASVAALLSQFHFRVIASRRTSMLPHNLTPIQGMRGIMNRFARPVLWADHLLSAIPILNRTAEAIEILAVKDSL